MDIDYLVQQTYTVACTHMESTNPSLPPPATLPNPHATKSVFLDPDKSSYHLIIIIFKFSYVSNQRNHSPDQCLQSVLL